jgi:hypothetical protein
LCANKKVFHQQIAFAADKSFVRIATGKRLMQSMGVKAAGGFGKGRKEATRLLAFKTCKN